MSLLDEASFEERGPLVCTIVGEPGTGKTSLAATFPKPFMIRTQGERVPDDSPAKPKSLPGVTDTSDKLFGQLKALIHDAHDYQSLIIDSVTGLESMFIAEVLASDPKAKGISQALGGYGAGRDAVAAGHMRVRKAVEIIRRERGMNTVFLAHADIQDIDLPDMDPFSKYSLRLHKKSMKSYVDDVDLVGFLKQATILTGEGENKKARTTGDIVLVTYLTPSSVAKNRLGIREDIEVKHGENPLAGYVAGGVVKKKETKE
jgi:hypothetical protein